MLCLVKILRVLMNSFLYLGQRELKEKRDWQASHFAAIPAFAVDVEDNTYPQPQHSVRMQPAEFEKFAAGAHTA